MKPPNLQAALSFWVDNLEDLALRSRPMWRFSPQQFYNLWLKGITWIADCMILDALIHGYGGFWLEYPDSEPELFVAPPPNNMPWDE
eukprot:327705-Rhodomonas_salina.1